MIKIAMIRLMAARLAGETTRWSNHAATGGRPADRQGCQTWRVVIQLPNSLSAETGQVILDTTLALSPGVPAEHQVTVPKPIKRPYWVRCFVVGRP